MTLHARAGAYVTQWTENFEDPSTYSAYAEGGTLDSSLLLTSKGSSAESWSQQTRPLPDTYSAAESKFIRFKRSSSDTVNALYNAVNANNSVSSYEGKKYVMEFDYYPGKGAYSSSTYYCGLVVKGQNSALLTVRYSPANDGSTTATVYKGDDANTTFGTINAAYSRGSDGTTSANAAYWYHVAITGSADKVSFAISKCDGTGTAVTGVLAEREEGGESVWDIPTVLFLRSATGNKNYDSTLGCTCLDNVSFKLWDDDATPRMAAPSASFMRPGINHLYVRAWQGLTDGAPTPTVKYSVNGGAEKSATADANGYALINDDALDNATITAKAVCNGYTDSETQTLTVAAPDAGKYAVKKSMDYATIFTASTGGGNPSFVSGAILPDGVDSSIYGALKIDSATDITGGFVYYTTENSSYYRRGSANSLKGLANYNRSWGMILPELTEGQIVHLISVPTPSSTENLTAYTVDGATTYERYYTVDADGAVKISFNANSSFPPVFGLRVFNPKPNGLIIAVP